MDDVLGIVLGNRVILVEHTVTCIKHFFIKIRFNTGLTSVITSLMNHDVTNVNKLKFNRPCDKTLWIHTFVSKVTASPRDTTHAVFTSLWL